jgi:hypothetical protein
MNKERVEKINPHTKKSLLKYWANIPHISKYLSTVYLWRFGVGVKKKIDRIYEIFHQRSVGFHGLALLGLFAAAVLFGGLLYGACFKVSQEKFSLPEIPNYREMKLKKIVAGTSLEAMAAEISRFDIKTSAFLVAIAKKESNWGKYAPRKNGKNCYNYWGYRGNENPTLSGYSCFDSPDQAVSVVGTRVEELVSQGADTPREIVVWKCGSSCAGFSPESVEKWISDVNFYFQKIVN